jgi:UDP-N-acetylmuramoylalanine--D-glutamate ligase
MFGDLRGRRVTVMGLGRFGGGVGAVRFLAERGARVTVTDLADAATLADSLAKIAGLKIERLRLGGHDEEDFRGADLIVASPAVPIDHPLLAAAEAAGMLVTTEIGLFWAHCRGRIIGVTGSVGKSTTAAMIHAIFTGAGRRAWLGGNIGGSLLSEVDGIERDDWVVLELSSFQLERLAPLRPRPTVAVVTTLRPNHLDRHGTLDAYRAAKQNLLRWQTADDIAVLNADDPDVSTWPVAGRVLWFGQEGEGRQGAFLAANNLLFREGGSTTSLPVSLHIPGEHHRLNAAAAAAAAFAVGIEPQAIVAALNHFSGLPHRLQMVGEFAGRSWVNDSKATTPESAIAALRSFDRRVRLIAGGADKGVDLAPLADEIARRGIAVYLSGRTAPMIAARLAERGHRSAAVYEAFDASVIAAWTDSRLGDVILLSPACASWGQFRDYRERGERFSDLARRLTGADMKPNAP